MHLLASALNSLSAKMVSVQGFFVAKTDLDKKIRIFILLLNLPTKIEDQS